MKNMPPKEMWILSQGVKCRYYRTEQQVLKFLNKEIEYYQMMLRGFYADLWYIDFTSDSPFWIKVPEELWLLADASKRQIRSYTNEQSNF